MKPSLTMPFFCDCGVTSLRLFGADSTVLKSSCSSLFIAVFRAVLPCTNNKMTIVRGAL